MAVFCTYKLLHGRDSCATDCPAAGPEGVFRYVRIESPAAVPAPDPLLVDVAVLDMNHGWPNLGHDSLVHALQDAACDLRELHESTGLAVRVLSYDVRRGGVVPEPPGGRFGLYAGTGGPGHIDPRCNDGHTEGSQGIAEDPGWEPRVFDLFDSIRASSQAALIGVCHTFGVMCRWSGVARPVLRGEDKGGKSSGVLENVYSPEASRHPWFSRFTEALGPARRVRILDNRLYDLIPDGDPHDHGMPIGWETLGVGGAVGDALTMMEFERDPDGVMPRVFGVNHHPEIVDRVRQRLILKRKIQRGEATPEWAAEREEILTRSYPDEDSEEQLHMTSEATLLAPLRFHLYRQVRLRTEAMGLRGRLHENDVLEASGPAAVAAARLENGAHA